ncbi:MAG TPA: hypothetical protein VK861_06105, partial [Bacteroidales bacterium]|nr:hypothetical protein [Bacteroidales bacterium]
YEGRVLPDAEILFVDRGFNVLGSGYSNEAGEYYLQINEITNGSVISTHSYGEKYLAYTFANVSTGTSHHIDVILGNVEFIHFTREMSGDRDTYTCRFQLASLTRMRSGALHLSPETERSFFEVRMDDQVLSEFELSHTSVKIQGKEATIDNYLLSFKTSVKDRGKVLSLAYHRETDFGALKTYL